MPGIALGVRALLLILATGGRTCRWYMEESAVALDFRCDESRNLPDMCGPFKILVNVHVKGARNRHLVGQHRNQRWVPGCNKSRQQAKSVSRQSRVKLRQDVRAPDAGFDSHPNRIGVIEDPRVTVWREQ